MSLFEAIIYNRKMEKKRKIILKDKKLKNLFKGGGRKEAKKDFFELIKLAALTEIKD
jgi:hypothetical protein